jgi:DNA repair exonuclease SbcCD ATPase subunit
MKLKEKIKKGLKKPLNRVEKAAIGIGLAAALIFGGVEAYDYATRNPIERKTPNIIAPRDMALEDIANDTEANRLLWEFPEEIPGARKVDKYVVDDARYCLVHIRQAHLVKDISEENKEKVAKVQADIYKSLSYLCDNNELKGVYAEAIVPETESLPQIMADLGHVGDRLNNSLNYSYRHEQETLKKEIKNLEKRIKDYSDEKEIPIELLLEGKSDKKDFQEYISGLEQELKRKKDKLKDVEKNIDAKKQEINKNKEERFKYSAVNKLVYEGKLKVIAAETLYHNMLGEIFIEEEGDWKKDVEKIKKVVDDREDVLLKIIDSRANTMNVSVYGGAHAWGGNDSFGDEYSLSNRISVKDNIAEWNKKHPDRKFSLIEITPESYDLD